MALSPAPAPKQGHLIHWTKLHTPALFAGSQVASAFKTLGLVPTGPASTLAVQQTGPLTVHRKPGWVFLLDTRKQCKVA